MKAMCVKELEVILRKSVKFIENKTSIKRGRKYQNLLNSLMEKI